MYSLVETIVKDLGIDHVWKRSGSFYMLFKTKLITWHWLWSMLSKTFLTDEQLPDSHYSLSDTVTDRNLNLKTCDASNFSIQWKRAMPIHIKRHSSFAKLNNYIGCIWLNEGNKSSGICRIPWQICELLHFDLIENPCENLHRYWEVATEKFDNHGDEDTRSLVKSVRNEFEEGTQCQVEEIFCLLLDEENRWRHKMSFDFWL